MMLPDDLATIARMTNPDALREGDRFPASDAGAGPLVLEDDAMLLRAVIASATCFEDEPAMPGAVVAA